MSVPCVSASAMLDEGARANLVTTSGNDGHRRLEGRRTPLRAARTRRGERPRLQWTAGSATRPCRPGRMRSRRRHRPSGHRGAAVGAGALSIVLIGLVQRVEPVAPLGSSLRHWIVAIEQQSALRRNDDRLVEPQRTKGIGSSSGGQNECRSPHGVADAVQRSYRETVGAQSGRTVVGHTRPRPNWPQAVARTFRGLADRATHSGTDR